MKLFRNLFGGAHTNHKEAAELLRPILVRSIEELSKMKV